MTKCNSVVHYLAQIAEHVNNIDQKYNHNLNCFASCLGRQLMMRFYPDFKNLQIYQGVHGYQSIHQKKAKCYMPKVTRYSEDNNVTQTPRLVVMILHQERAIKKPKTYYRKMQRFSQFSQGLSVLTSRLTSSKDSNLRSVSRDNIC